MYFPTCCWDFCPLVAEKIGNLADRQKTDPAPKSVTHITLISNSVLIKRRQVIAMMTQWPINSPETTERRRWWGETREELIRAWRRENMRKCVWSWDGEKGWRKAEILDRRWGGAPLSWNTPAAATRSPAFHQQAALTFTPPGLRGGVYLSFMCICRNFWSDELKGTLQDIVLSFDQHFTRFSFIFGGKRR